jgi:hypothetical protein
MDTTKFIPTSSSIITINNIPDEIIAHIASFLDFKDLLNFLFTSRRFLESLNFRNGYPKNFAVKGNLIVHDEIPRNSFFYKILFHELKFNFKKRIGITNENSKNSEDYYLLFNAKCYNFVKYETAFSRIIFPKSVKKVKCDHVNADFFRSISGNLGITTMCFSEKAFMTFISFEEKDNFIFPSVETLHIEINEKEILKYLYSKRVIHNQVNDNEELSSLFVRIMKRFPRAVRLFLTRNFKSGDQVHNILIPRGIKFLRGEIKFFVNRFVLFPKPGRIREFFNSSTLLFFELLEGYDKSSFDFAFRKKQKVKEVRITCYLDVKTVEFIQKILNFFEPERFHLFVIEIRSNIEDYYLSSESVSSFSVRFYEEFVYLPHMKVIYDFPNLTTIAEVSNSKFLDKVFRKNE